jgi:hypothetical protein
MWKRPETLNPTNLVMDEPVLVSNDGEHWDDKHFARYAFTKYVDGIECWGDGWVAGKPRFITSSVPWKYWKRPETDK